MKKIFAQILASVVILVIGTLVGGFVEKHRTEAQGKIRFLDVAISKGKSILSRPTIPGKNIEIMLEGKPIGNLSEVTLGIYNFTDRDYSEVLVYIELIPQGGTTLDVVGQQAVGENNLPEAVEPISNVSPSNIKGASRYGYKIRNVNRTGELIGGASFQVRFLLLGDEVPEVKVAIDKVGLKLQEFSYQRSAKGTLALIRVVIAISFIAYCFLFFTMLRYIRRIQLKKDLKFQENLQSAFHDVSIQANFGIRPDKSGALAMYIRWFLQKDRWEQTPKLLRFMSGFSKPEAEPSTKNTGTVQQPHGPDAN